MPSELFYLNSLDLTIFSLRGVRSVFIITSSIEIPVNNANSKDPDQTPRSVASDLGLHCLHMSLLWDARLKWVKGYVLRIASQQLHNIIFHRQCVEAGNRFWSNSLRKAV